MLIRFADTKKLYKFAEIYSIERVRIELKRGNIV